VIEMTKEIESMTTPKARSAGYMMTRALIAVAACAAAVLVAAAPASADFGIASFTASVSTTQAGAHPDATTAFAFNLKPSPVDPGLPPVPDEHVKTISVDLPPGLVGNPQAASMCSKRDFAQSDPLCPASSQVGLATITVFNPFFPVTEKVAVFNLAPGPRQVAVFGMSILSHPALLEARLRSDGSYGITVESKNIPEPLVIAELQMTFWGVPADPSHDAERWNVTAPIPCLPGGPDPTCPGPNPAGVARRPFMTNPTECTAAPVPTTLRVRSWQHPDQEVSATTTSPPATGCDQLHFDPTLRVQPDTTQADAPSGYEVDLEIPQNDNPDGLAEAQLKKAVVTLPKGVSIAPGGADGLQGCSGAQIGLTNGDVPTCPDASKIGTVEVTTPVFSDPLKGDIYLAKPPAGADINSMYRIFLVIEGHGLLIKLEGSVRPDPNTGQLTTTFENNPQVPFSKFVLRFKGGPRAPLVNPTSCGTFTTRSKFTGWNGGTAQPSDSFDVTGCTGPRPFNPSFTAGTVTPLAGAFSPFTMTISRPDGQQELSGVSVSLPPGLLGMVAGVPLCEEVDAARGTCSDLSQVGTTTVSAGPGSHPFTIGGKVFLGGVYKGAPYSLSIVVHAVAGPFDLGTVVVRAPINVNASIAKLDVPADPLPTILQGVPLRLRTITVTMNRSNFTFNPTSCDKMSVGARLTSTEGAVADVSSPFQVGGCAGLPFKPDFRATSSGKATRKNGASLHVHIGQKPGEAAIKSVAVTLPRKLPARLVPTINGACPFEVERDKGHTACPESSKVGWATARTPVLPDPLEGPAYIVAKGDALPKLSIYLRGNNIDLQLDGDIDINPKTNLTKTTFTTIPDVPITSFDLDLPKGAHSALAAPGNDLCQGTMKMITTIIAQNGEQIDRKEPLKVSGCGTSIASKKVGSSSVSLALENVGAGRVTARGLHLRTTKRTITNGTTASMTVPLSAQGRRTLARQGTLTVKVRVSYTPAKGQPQLSTKSRHTAATVTFTRGGG
jgi:hypothetical protein